VADAMKAGFESSGFKLQLSPQNQAKALTWWRRDNVTPRMHQLQRQNPKRTRLFISARNAVTYLKSKQDGDTLAGILKESEWRRTPLSVWRYRTSWPIGFLQDCHVERRWNGASLLRAPGKNLGLSHLT